MAEWLPSIITGGSTIIAVLIAGCIANGYQKKQHKIKTTKDLTTETCKLLRKIVDLSSSVNQWIVIKSEKNKKSLDIIKTQEALKLSLTDFKIDLDILRNKMNIQLRISSQDSEEINKIYYAYKETNGFIVNDFKGNPEEDFVNKIQNELDKIEFGIYEIMNIILRSKIRFRRKKIKKPVIQKSSV